MKSIPDLDFINSNISASDMRRLPSILSFIILGAAEAVPTKFSALAGNKNNKPKIKYENDRRRQ